MRHINKSISGRVFHTMGQIPEAINFLRQGLAIAQSLNKSEEEAKIRHRLGNKCLLSYAEYANKYNQIRTITLNNIQLLNIYAYLVY